MAIDWTKPIETLSGKPVTIDPGTAEGDNAWISYEGARYEWIWCRDYQPEHGEGIRNVEQKEEVKVAQFKVGDRVRYVGEPTAGLVVGNVYDVVGISWDRRTPLIVDSDGDERDREYDNYELATEATDELATLRAFRDAAIARYPDLAEPESDEDAAKRFAKGWDNHDFDTWDEAVLAAIQWARANPR